jgi:Superfamily I DNA and RNA helicases and helicase subunits
MEHTIAPKLESSRKELLDLSMRNSLLNYRIPKARGLHIIQEKSSAIFDILVSKGKSMTFLGRPDNNDESEDNELPELPPLSDEQQRDAYLDTKLQTSESEKKLQSKILNTYYFARTSIEEQGVNILYLAMGMLNWYEKGNEKDVRQAPLILIPVILERSSASERFRLRYSGSEIGANLSLQAKMLAEFNITIPDLSDVEDFDIDAYFNDIAGRIQKEKGWSVEKDTIELGFFSFGKFMIYNDLDTSQWPSDHKPEKHKAITALFGDGFDEPHPSATDDHHIDHDTVADELFQVVDADSSQVLAMLAVHEGRNMVIQGPPGTGKSQTITNIIANAVGHGKKVLFVAEKMAALEVVKRRMDNIHLGEACLELHSHKANKRELHEELKRVLDLGRPAVSHLESEIQLLDEHRARLNAYCDAVNTAIEKSGLSPQRVMGYLLDIDKRREHTELPKIPITNPEQWDADRIRRAEDMADVIEARLADIGQPSELLFYGTGLTVFHPHERSAFAGSLNAAITATDALVSYTAALATKLGVQPPDSEDAVQSLVKLFHWVEKRPELTDINIKNPAWITQEEDIRELLDTGERLAALHREYDEILLPEAWEQQMIEIRQNILLHGGKWYKFLIGEYKRSVKQLAAFSRQVLPKDANEKLRIVDAVLEGRRLSATVAELDDLAKVLFGHRWNRQRSNWASLRTAFDYLNQTHKQIAERRLPEQLLAYLDNLVKDKEENDEHSPIVEQRLLEQLASWKQVLQQFEFEEYDDAKQLAQLSLRDQLVRLQQWQAGLDQIHLAIAWNNLVEESRSKGFAMLTESALQWNDASRFLKMALQKSWYEYLIEQAMAHYTPLKQFERTSHEELITKFRRLDELNQQYNRVRVALAHYQSIPRQDGGGQLNVLRSEFNKKARHIPIRKLMQEAGLAIQAIKPVFMMSPLSIANFLPPGSISFDLVIFDEASQVRPVEALGAIMRGKQLVVVGDSRQLPPTSFFDKLNAEVAEEEENETADLQSILGMCNGKGTPERMLRWHYRSRHESLISLSNYEFYENKLVIFPSPGSRRRLGLAFHHLPHAVYERGKTRTNPIEAAAVADAVISHAQHSPKESLGVAAFSTTQMQAIQHELEIRRRQHPELESFFRSHPNEPFFVKNLENVQGDERDVIFISIGYGRIEDGKVPMSFGPLNNDGGERRLNVLITRAKYRCEVFANITAEDIRITPNTKFGIRALKSFLYFAQHGVFDVDTDIALVEERPFEDFVADRLEADGFKVRRKVGSSGFFIDLAIVDPQHPGRYLLGIQCDGTNYAGAKSARDRDRLRNQVLNGIGWSIYSIWSTDWYRNPEREYQRLLEARKKAEEKASIQDIEEEESALEWTTIMRENTDEPKNQIPFYEFAKLPSDIIHTEFHLHPIGRLAAWMDEVVRIESPVHFDEVARRMVNAAGLMKVGGRIRQCLVDAMGFAERGGMINVKGDFLWRPDMDIPTLRDRSALPSGSKKMEFIAMEEIATAVNHVVKDAIAISPEDAVPLVAKVLGFARATEEMRKYILESVEFSIQQGNIVKTGELLKMKN